MINTAVPPNEKFWLLPPVIEKKKFGRTATMPRTCAGQRDARQDELQVLRGRASRSDTRDEAAVLLHVVGALDGLNVDAT